MLVALNNDQRFEADAAEKGLDYYCPNCRGEVILKKGRIVIHHFAHKAETVCLFAKPESPGHVKAKGLFQNLYKERGHKADIEFIVHTLPNDRRADVMVHPPKGRPVAIELQDSTIDLDEIEKRTQGYCNAGIPVLWLPFARKKYWDEKIPSDDAGWNFLISKYAARPFERWIHGYNFKEGAEVAKTR